MALSFNAAKYVYSFRRHIYPYNFVGVTLMGMFSLSSTWPIPPRPRQTVSWSLLYRAWRGIGIVPAGLKSSYSVAYYWIPSICPKMNWGTIWLAPLGHVLLDRSLIQFNTFSLTKVLNVPVFIFWPLDSARIAASFHLQFNEGVYVLDKVSSFVRY
jgi:hypothetical protein